MKIPFVWELIVVGDCFATYRAQVLGGWVIQNSNWSFDSDMNVVCESQSMVFVPCGSDWNI